MQMDGPHPSVSDSGLQGSVICISNKLPGDAVTIAQGSTGPIVPTHLTF